MKKKSSRKILFLLLALFAVALGIFLIIRYTELFGFIVGGETKDELIYYEYDLAGDPLGEKGLVIVRRAGWWDGDVEQLEPLKSFATGSEPWNGVVMTFDLSKIPDNAIIKDVSLYAITYTTCDDYLSPQKTLCTDEGLSKACMPGGVVKFFSMPRHALEYSTNEDLFNDLNNYYISGKIYEEFTSYCNHICGVYSRYGPYCAVGTLAGTETYPINMYKIKGDIEEALSRDWISIGMMMDRGVRDAKDQLKEGHYWIWDMEKFGDGREFELDLKVTYTV